MTKVTNNQQVQYSIIGDDKPGVLKTIGLTIVDTLSAARTTVSAINEVALATESLARTGHQMAERNEKYVSEKGEAMHEARMSQLHADIQRAKQYRELAETPDAVESDVKL